jgi:hypothetical protein
MGTVFLFFLQAHVLMLKLSTRFLLYGKGVEFLLVLC